MRRSDILKLSRNFSAPLATLVTEEPPKTEEKTLSFESEIPVAINISSQDSINDEKIAA